MLIGTARFLALLPIAIGFMVGIAYGSGIGAHASDKHDIRPLDWQTNPPSPDAGIDFNVLESYLAGQTSPTSSKSGTGQSGPSSSRSAAGQSDLAPSKPKTGKRKSRALPGSFRAVFRSTDPKLYCEYCDADYISKYPNKPRTEQLKKITRPYSQVRQALKVEHPNIHQLLLNEEQVAKRRSQAKPGSIGSLRKQEKDKTISTDGQAKLNEHRAKEVKRVAAFRERKKAAKQQGGQSA